MMGRECLLVYNKSQVHQSTGECRIWCILENPKTQKEPELMVSCRTYGFAQYKGIQRPHMVEWAQPDHSKNVYL